MSTTKHIVEVKFIRNEHRMDGLGPETSIHEYVDREAAEHAAKDKKVGLGSSGKDFDRMLTVLRISVIDQLISNTNEVVVYENEEE
jgi:hypothetical protein